jgi:hypothetical protein
MTQESFDPYTPWQEAPVVFPGETALAQKEPNAKFLRPLPTSMLVLGLTLLLGFFCDQVISLPPRFYDVAWRIACLEKVFNEASILLLGITISLGGIWLGDFLAGAKNKALNLTFGCLGIAFGLMLLFAVPLYSMDMRILQKFKLTEIENQRKEAQPEPGSEDAAKYDAAIADLNVAIFKNVFRMNANAILVGTSLILLGSFGVRQVRDKAGVGFCCPNCMSEDICLSPMDPSESSLAFATRLHMFLCHECGWRFRRFSLTGKPFTFFF